jgi:flagellar basal body-associated protein FliL
VKKKKKKIRIIMIIVVEIILMMVVRCIPAVFLPLSSQHWLPMGVVIGKTLVLSNF